MSGNGRSAGQQISEVKKSGGKIALVLAGGGLTGAVYEIGALRAIDELLVNLSVNDVDIFVGTSAGALVSAFLANGITPEQMMRSLDGSLDYVQPIQRKHIFNIPRSELVRIATFLPKRLITSWLNYVNSIGEMTFFDLLWSLLDTLPAGFYDGGGLDRYVQHVIKQAGYSNQFDELKKDLFIIATDLDSGKRKIFDRSTPNVPVSMAVAASSAIPIMYKPVRIQGSDYVDGGMRGNASLDVAIEQGADLVVCINPMVPYDNADHHSIPDTNEDFHYISEKGANFVASQVTRIMTHSAIRYHVKQLRRSHPNVDIILVEPEAKDYRMFFYNVMKYSARLEIARHGFESVTYGMASEYKYYKDVLSWHGIEITRRRVIQQLEQIKSSNYQLDVIRDVMESRQTDCNGGERNSLYCQLNETLEELDRILQA